MAALLYVGVGYVVHVFLAVSVLYVIVRVYLPTCIYLKLWEKGSQRSYRCVVISPLSLLPTLAEEEPQNGGGEMMERSRKPNEDRGGVSVFTTLGTLVLTARPYEPVAERTKACRGDCLSGGNAADGHGAALQGEIFQTVNKEVCVFMVDCMCVCTMYMHSIHSCYYVLWLYPHVHVQCTCTCNIMYVHICTCSCLAWASLSPFLIINCMHLLSCCKYSK